MTPARALPATLAAVHDDAECPSCGQAPGTSLAYVLDEHTSTIEDGPGSENEPYLCGGSEVAVAYPDIVAPTACDDEWAEWQVDRVTVGTGNPVCLYVEGRDGFPIEVPVPDPHRLVAVLLSAAAGEWGPADPSCAGGAR